MGSVCGLPPRSHCGLCSSLTLAGVRLRAAAPCALHRRLPKRLAVLVTGVDDAACAVPLGSYTGLRPHLLSGEILGQNIKAFFQVAVHRGDFAAQGHRSISRDDFGCHGRGGSSGMQLSALQGPECSHCDGQVQHICEPCQPQCSSLSSAPDTCEGDARAFSQPEWCGHTGGTWVGTLCIQQALCASEARSGLCVWCMVYTVGPVQVRRGLECCPFLRGQGASVGSATRPAQ